MIKFLQNKFTILFEIIILVLSTIWFFNNYEIEPLIAVLFSLSGLITPFVKIKETPKTEFLGDVNEKNLHKNFLTNYIPGKINILKIIEEFGQPNSKIKDYIVREWNNDEKAFFYVYKYNFSNAVVLFTTAIDDDNIISISLASQDITKPIYCRYSYCEEDELLGEAEFKKSILDNLVKYENRQFPSWGYSAITSRYIEYRPIKYLFFTYFNYNFYEEADDLFLETIDGICISTSSEIHPIIGFDDYMFN